MKIVQQPFGTLPTGKDVDLFTLDNGSGMQVSLTNYGGIVTSIVVGDRGGRPADVVLGHDSLDGYVNRNDPYFGALIGRYANRIAGGRFTLDGTEYTLARNNGPHHLHGGVNGFDRRPWTLDGCDDSGACSVRLSLESPDGDEGYPGTLRVNVVYSLTADNELIIDYFAECDAATVLNLTNHSYFNLSGGTAGTILDHEIMINADRFTAVDDTQIPTGEILPVGGTPLDFRTPVRIGERIDEPHPQLAAGGGYDNNWVLGDSGGNITVEASACDPSSGRFLEVLTTEPGLQFYSGNFLDGSVVGKGDRAYPRRAGFCLEAQHFPDSPNHSTFPSTVLTPGETYAQTTIYRFSTR